MKAAVLVQIGQPFVIRDDLTIDDPIGREILVDVKASGLCHSDLYVATTELGTSLPAVLGHEAAGIVTKVGPQVTQFKVGDHIIACLAGFCGHCDRCHVGKTNLCRNYPSATQRTADMPPRLRMGGEPVFQFSEISGFAEQILVHENNAVAVSRTIPFPQAAIIGCSVTTGMGAAINSAAIRAGENVAVIGCGGVGLNTVQGAALVGARRIIAIDIDPVKLELAHRFGATDVINSNDIDPVKRVIELTGGGVDHAFEIVGSILATLEQSRAMLAPGGTAYFLGAQPPSLNLSINPLDSIFNKTALQGVYMGGTNFKYDIPFYVDLYGQKRLNLDDLVSNYIRLDQINEAYAAIERGGIARTVITSF